MSTTSSMHQEEGSRPRQPALPGKVDPVRGCGQWATKRVARVSALLGKPLEGILFFGPAKFGSFCVFTVTNAQIYS